MRALITNTTLLNTGDSAIVDATIAILRETFGADLDVICYDAHACAAARYRHGVALRPTVFDQVVAWAGAGMRRKLALISVLVAAGLTRWGVDPSHIPLPLELRRTLKEYRDADVVISAGGTYLVPNYRLAPRIYDFLVTLAIGRPLILFTQSLGPFPRGRNRWLLRRILRRVRLIMVRDQRSLAHLLELGIPARRVVVCPDAAFALAPARIETHRQRDDNPPRIAISVRDWPFFDDGPAELGMARYASAVAGFVRHAVDIETAQVTFISSCQGAPEYWTDDSRVALAICERLPPSIRSGVTLDRRFRSAAELIEQLKSYDLVVATRMHVAILALCAGVPVIPVAYEFKTRELATWLGLGEVVQDIERISSAGLISAWSHFREHGDALKATLWQQVSIARRAALASGGLVQAALRSSA